jgi:hypothetical protein
VLTRLGELGVRVIGGRIQLMPSPIPPAELFSVDASQGVGAARFTFCSVAMTLDAGVDDAVTVERVDGTHERRAGSELSAQESQEIFTRSGAITRVDWRIGSDTLARWARMASDS